MRAGSEVVQGFANGRKERECAQMVKHGLFTHWQPEAAAGPGPFWARLLTVLAFWNVPKNIKVIRWRLP